MAPDDGDDTIRAKIVSYLDRQGFYCPKDADIEQVANRSGVATHDVGRARELTHELARDDSTPVRYQVRDQTVCLETDSHSWAAATISRFDADQLEWSQRERL